MPGDGSRDARTGFRPRPGLEGRRAAPARLAPADVFRLALVLGLSTGLLEAGARAAQRARHQFTWVSPDVVWMAPLANLSLVLLIAALLPLLARFAPAASPMRMLLGAAAFAVFAAAFLSYGPLHPAAGLLLAAGLALRLSAIAANHGDRLIRASRRVWPWLVAAVLLAALAVRAGESPARALPARDAPAARSGGPSILLIVLDTVRAASLSVNGYGRPTSPALERLARQGAYFERAVATSSWTLPSHSTLFTGRYPHELTADWRSPLDGAHPTLAETLAARGYATAGFVSNLLYATKETGLARGFARYDDYRVTMPTAIKSSLVARQIGRALGVQPGSPTALTERRSAGEINDSLLRWIDERRRTAPDQPFFAFVNYMDAHAPYRPPPAFAERFGATGPPPDIDERRTWTAREIAREQNAYDAAIAFLDQQLGELFRALDHRGVLGRTIVAITSDHGELFGEHTLYDHGNGLYWPTLHVPLLIVYPPAVPAGLRIAEPVTLRDVPATLLDLAGVRPPAWPGRSLAGFWTGRPDDRPASPLLSAISQGINLDARLPASRGDMRSLVAGTMHYIRNGDGTEELYDLARDPEEKTNLAAGGAPGVAAFRAALNAALDGAGR